MVVRPRPRGRVHDAQPHILVARQGADGGAVSAVHAGGEGVGVGVEAEELVGPTRAAVGGLRVEDDWFLTILHVPVLLGGLVAAMDVHVGCGVVSGGGSYGPLARLVGGWDG